MMKLTWNPKETPEKIASALRTLAEEYPLSEQTDGTPLRFKKSDFLSVAFSSDGVTVTYTTTASALRGVGLALAGVETTKEACPFEMFGVMLDNSRNAVMTLPYAKSVLRRLALAGYNMAMLYTEDTYQLPEEPHFGFLRGSYSLEEVRELDEYAASLGIELIGCIQTLGHLATFLRYAGAQNVKDTANVLLADEPETYDLIRKMISFWSRACRSRRIHIGMDETHDLGRGKFMDRNGWRKNSDIFQAHLEKVCSICRENGLKPMIWSDMFFRMASKTQDYYDVSAVIPESVKRDVPPAVDLVYWDYYHLNEEFYDRMIQIHRTFNREPLMGSGIWTWYRLTYDHKQTIDRVAPCIDSCRKNRIREFFFTMWGDDGAYCGFDTVSAGILWSADRAYGISGEDSDRLEKISSALHCSSYKQALIASGMNWQAPHRDNGVGTLSILLWDDPILGYGWRLLRLDKKENQTDLDVCLTGSLDRLTEYPYAVATGELLRFKLRMQSRLRAAYQAKDHEALLRIKDTDIPQIITLYDKFASAFRQQWLARYKYNGMETIQVRIGGLQARCQELARRIQEWLDGNPEALAEQDLQPDERSNPSRERYIDFAAAGLF